MSNGYGSRQDSIWKKNHCTWVKGLQDMIEQGVNSNLNYSNLKGSWIKTVGAMNTQGQYEHLGKRITRFGLIDQSIWLKQNWIVYQNACHGRENGCHGNTFCIDGRILLWSRLLARNLILMVLLQRGPHKDHFATTFTPFVHVVCKVGSNVIWIQVWKGSNLCNCGSNGC